LRTIHAADLTDEQYRVARATRRRRKQAEAARRRRRRAHIVAPDPKPPPWKAAGVSRATWFRDRAAAEVELTNRAAAILHVVNDHGRITILKIARTVTGWHDFKGLTDGSLHRTVARNVAALEAAGLVTTIRPHANFVAVRVSTTAKGRLSSVTPLELPVARPRGNEETSK